MNYNQAFKQIQYCFEHKETTRKQEWKEIKKEFIDLALEALVKEKDIINLVFQLNYYRIVDVSDQEIYEHIVENFVKK